MANERNAGRKQKYDEETVLLCMRVPASKKEEVKKLVSDFLLGILNNGLEVEVKKNAVVKVGDTIYISESVGENQPRPSAPKKNASKQKLVTNPDTNCDCYIDGKIMRRGESQPTCKLTRPQHKHLN